MKEYFEKIYKETIKKFHKIVENNLKNNKKTFIITANPETLMLAEENNDLKKAILADNTLVVPDGIGVIKGAKILGYKIEETILGVELCAKLFEYCKEQNKSIFLFGAKQETVKKLVEKIGVDYPQINICGYENGYVENKQEVFDRILELQPDVVLVALGIPHQETIIYKNLEKFNKGIFVGVGGSFDVLSGLKRRAPKIFIKLHLEWLYRIIREPSRLKRFFKSNIRYIFMILKEKYYENK